jgi:hypothetical protein
VHLQIDGDRLERWFFKTLINITVGGKEKIGPKSDTPGEPSSDLVEIAFGHRKFVPNAGLYIIPPANEKFSETYFRLVKEGTASEFSRPETMMFYPL